MAYASLPSAPAPGPRRRRRGLIALVVAGCALLLAILGVVADVLARNMAEAEFAHQLEQSLPTGTSGRFQVDIHGFSFLWQAAQQRYERVEVRSDDLSAAGIPLVLEAEGRDVAMGGAPTAGSLDGSLRLGPEAANALVTIPGATSQMSFGDGTVAFTSEVRVLGFPMGVDAEGTVDLDGREIVVDLTTLRFQAGGMDADPHDLWPEFGGSRIPICVERWLPQGVRLSDLQIAPDGVTARFEAERLRLDEASLSQRGSCP